MTPRAPRKPVLTEVDGDGHVTVLTTTPDTEAGLPPVVGDLIEAVTTNPHPVIHTGDNAATAYVHVIVDVTRARLEDTPDCIRLGNVPADGWVTASQTHWISVDSNVAADLVKGLRGDRGYDQ